MIIFYNKKTGKISGTIDGRIHSDAQLNMWIGDKKENGRVIIQWKPVISDDGHQTYEPDHKQKNVFTNIQKNKRLLKRYQVDVKTKKLTLIE